MKEDDEKYTEEGVEWNDLGENLKLGFQFSPLSIISSFLNLIKLSVYFLNSYFNFKNRKIVF